MPASTKDFRVLAVLGKGSYGTVSKVERLADGVCYALKEVNIKRLSPRERCVACPRVYGSTDVRGRWQRAGRASALAGTC